MFRSRWFRIGIVHRMVVIAGMFASAQTARAVDLIENFDNIADLESKGWTLKNLSEPIGTSSWFQGYPEVFDAQAGPADSYLAANLDNTAGVGTISDWAITPTNVYRNGDTVRFWTRTETDSIWPDRLEVRLSTNGASADVGDTAFSVGDFTGVLLEINPALESGGYPEVWTEYVITLSGLNGATAGRVAFRYFVTDAGVDASNANYIGIDTLRITTVPEPSTILLGMVTAVIVSLGHGQIRRIRSKP